MIMGKPIDPKDRVTIYAMIKSGFKNTEIESSTGIASASIDSQRRMMKYFEDSDWEKVIRTCGTAMSRGLADWVSEFTRTPIPPEVSRLIDESKENTKNRYLSKDGTLQTNDHEVNEIANYVTTKDLNDFGTLVGNSMLDMANKIQQDNAALISPLIEAVKNLTKAVSETPTHEDHDQNAIRICKQTAIAQQEIIKMMDANFDAQNKVLRDYLTSIATSIRKRGVN